MKKVSLSPKEIQKIRKPFTRVAWGRMLGITPQAIYLWEKGRERPSGPARRLLGLLKGQMRRRIVRWLRKIGV
jgi:DNA-binding transcriptional regulator YiaG